MTVTREEKAEMLKGLIDQFSRSKTVIFSDYRGIKVKDLSALRRSLRKTGSEMKVAKKTLIRLAAKENKIESLDDKAMEGSVAVTFSYEDELSGLKALFQFSKTNDKLKLLGGVINGQVVSADIVKQYAKLPSRQELLAKLVGVSQAPISGFVSLLNNVIAGFVRALKAIGDKQPPQA